MWSQILVKMAVNRLGAQSKSTKNMKLSTIFGGFQRLGDPSYHIFEATFQQ